MRACLIADDVLLVLQSVSITQWATNATSGAAARTNLNCEVKGKSSPSAF